MNWTHDTPRQSGTYWAKVPMAIGQGEIFDYKMLVEYKVGSDFSYITDWQDNGWVFNCTLTWGDKVENLE